VIARKAATPRRRRGVLLASLLLAAVGLAAVLATGPDSRRAPGVTAAITSVTEDAPRPVASERAPAAPPTPAVGPRSGAVERELARPAESPITAPDDRDTSSINTGDWRDQVAAALGHEAAVVSPLDAGAMRTDVADMPAEGTGAARASGLEGWDGGAFWFGPLGLVRVTGAQP
jgi:hypothetical protein